MVDGFMTDVAENRKSSSEFWRQGALGANTTNADSVKEGYLLSFKITGIGKLFSHLFYNRELCSL